MKTTFFLIIIFFARITLAFDIVDEVSDAIKKGNASAISKYFSTTIALKILEKDEVYSAAQAQIILKDFFTKYPPNNVKILHKVVSNANYKFGVILFNSSQQTFRIRFELRNLGGNFIITQIRIEENKD
jgi:hypothetical protein